MKNAARFAGRGLHVVVLVALPLCTVHCGDDESPTGSGGAGGDGPSTTSSSSSTSTTTTTSGSSTSGSSTSGGDGGGGAAPGSGGGDTGGGGGSFAEQHLAAMVDAICDHLAPCCEEEELPYDEAECASFMTLHLAYLVPSDPSLATHDPAIAAACIEAATALGSACPQSPAQVSAFATTCGRVFRGSLGASDACSSSPECASPEDGAAFCIPGPGGAVCNQLTFGAAGDRCEGDTLVTETGDRFLFSSSLEETFVLCDLDAGLVCDPGAVNPTCRALLEEGDACPGTGSCAEGLACLFDDAGGACRPRKDEDEPCRRDDPADGCQDGLHCEEASELCKPRLSVGEACGRGADCASGVCAEATGRCEGAYSNHFVCDGEAERAAADG